MPPVLKRHALAHALALALALFASGCGAKTGLLAPDIDAGPDVRRVDVVDVREMRAARCFPQRVRTRVGFTVNLRPDTDATTDTGYVWTMRQRPTNSRAELFSDGTQLAALMPDLAGTYEIEVEVPADTDAGVLLCPITVIADPPDPECPGYSIVEPRPVTVPGGTTQMAFDVVWGAPRTAGRDTTGAILADDPAGRVAAVVIERPATADVSNPGAALATEGTTVEDLLTREFAATPLLVGRTTATHDGAPLRRSTLRIGTGSVADIGVLRDRAMRAIASLDPPAIPAPVHTPAAAFYVEVATVLRVADRRVVTIVAFSPIAAVDDAAHPAATRIADLVNATSLARAGTPFEVDCHEIISTRTLAADFLWMVDTSASMNDDQQRVGETAERFFQNLNEAGVDFRVGVFQAGSRAISLTNFRWIPGTQADGAREMAFQVTEQRFRNDPMDTRRPFRVSGSSEEPGATSVIAIRTFEANRARGVTDPNLLLRQDAAHVVFMVTDEPGTNDLSRFFRTSAERAMWGNGNIATETARIADFFTSRQVLTFGLVPSFPGVPCPDDAKLLACAITAAGGSFIPIDLRNDAEVNAAFAAAMDRVVASVAGAASEFILPRVPLSGSLRARVDGRIAPRSRAEGFDYDDRTRALVFRGATFRPVAGQQVRVAYFYWVTP